MIGIYSSEFLFEVLRYLPVPLKFTCIQSAQPSQRGDQKRRKKVQVEGVNPDTYQSGRMKSVSFMWAGHTITGRSSPAVSFHTSCSI